MAHLHSDLEIDTFIYNKVPLYRLYFETRNQKNQLKRTVNMRQLWLPYPALGICIPNLGHFLASNNLTK